ncbi:MAG: hypothetical protein DMG09_23405 [Acidobacteria bacterium]|nr:MAG: hypothetical protein DMG09_23405 [Acidobacteriota bacterium]
MSEPRLRCGLGTLSVFLLLTGMLVASSSNPVGGQEQRLAVKPQREPIRVGGNVQESKLVHRVEPVYPPEATAARVSGVVILQVTVNEAGDVSDARVLRGHPLLDGAAVEAVRQWRYSPTLLNGEPVPVIATVSIAFPTDLERSQHRRTGLPLVIDELGNVQEQSAGPQEGDLTRKLNEANGVVFISPHPRVPFRVLEESLRALQKAGAKDVQFNGPYTFREGRLYYTVPAPEIQAPELALETERLAAVAKNSGRVETIPFAGDGRRVVLYQLFVNEVGEIAGVQVRGPQIPELEAELRRTRVVSPGRRGLESVPVVVLLVIPVE